MDFDMDGQVMATSLSNLLEEKQRECNVEQLMGFFQTQRKLQTKLNITGPAVNYTQQHVLFYKVQHRAQINILFYKVLHYFP